MSIALRVAALIPTFNRKAVTLACVAKLKSQSRPPDLIVVSDGGSTDGTPEVVTAAHPEVVVLRTPREAWWGGSMAYGFDYLLGQGLCANDRVLMLNDDTVLPPDYVEILLEVSLLENAAVCGVTVDAADNTKVLDSGEYIEWHRYVFPVANDWPGEKLRDDVAFLPGRATMVSLEMVRKVGNIDSVAFPHYIGDYDFFARIKKAGFRIGVTGRTWLGCMTEQTGLGGHGEPQTVKEVVKLATSQRSMERVIDHWRFIWRHAPGTHAKVRLIALVGIHGTKRLLSAAAGMAFR